MISHSSRLQIHFNPGYESTFDRMRTIFKIIKQNISLHLMLIDVMIVVRNKSNPSYKYSKYPDRVSLQRTMQNPTRRKCLNIQICVWNDSRWYFFRLELSFCVFKLKYFLFFSFAYNDCKFTLFSVTYPGRVRERDKNTSSRIKVLIYTELETFFVPFSPFCDKVENEFSKRIFQATLSLR